MGTSTSAAVVPRSTMRALIPSLATYRGVKPACSMYWTASCAKAPPPETSVLPTPAFGRSPTAAGTSSAPASSWDTVATETAGEHDVASAVPIPPPVWSSTGTESKTTVAAALAQTFRRTESVQAVPVQNCVAEQTVPQWPQLPGSWPRSTQSPEQHVRPPLQAPASQWIAPLP